MLTGARSLYGVDLLLDLGVAAIPDDRLSLTLGACDHDRRRAVVAGSSGGLLLGLHLIEQRLGPAVGLPPAEVQARDLLGQRVEVVLVDVPGALGPLLVVEELDVVPGLPL